MLHKIKFGLLIGAGVSVLATSAGAADLKASGAPVVKNPVALSKSNMNPFEGFYMGVHTGYSWADTDIDYAGTYAGSISSTPFSGPIDGNTKVKSDGWLLGAQAGYNHVFDSGILIGGEVSGSWAGITGTSSFDDGDVSLNGEQHINGLGFAQLKLGWANEKIAVYGLGGLALADVSETLTASDGLTLGSISGSRVAAGWTVGAGADFMISEKVSLGVVYNYAQLEYKTDYSLNESLSFFGFVNADIETESKLDVQTVKATLNYHF